MQSAMYERGVGPHKQNRKILQEGDSYEALSSDFVNKVNVKKYEFLVEISLQKKKNGVKKAKNLQWHWKNHEWSVGVLELYLFYNVDQSNQKHSTRFDFLVFILNIST